ncbi:hypothetical protein NDU88_006526 [Pleurodeles waltl]|uniref:Kinetochore protein Spc24 n=1 Tax=Pleurodeles waltl TaxID=8319 RepID=A0AAV7N183_PLEWA|nr:hypothetical protein NDU88_006526 [Pleurodeles waltl]
MHLTRAAELLVKKDVLAYVVEMPTNTAILGSKTFKVYIRGVTISKHAGALRSIQNSLAKLEKEQDALEQQHRVTRDHGLLGDIEAKIDEYHEQAQSEVEHLEKYAMVHIYGEGERLGATLTVTVHPCRDDAAILEIQDELRHPSYDMDKIVWRFCRYYSNLFMAQRARLS